MSGLSHGEYFCKDEGPISPDLKPVGPAVCVRNVHAALQVLCHLHQSAQRKHAALRVSGAQRRCGAARFTFPRVLAVGLRADRAFNLARGQLARQQGDGGTGVFELGMQYQSRAYFYRHEDSFRRRVAMRRRSKRLSGYRCSSTCPGSTSWRRRFRASWRNRPGFRIARRMARNWSDPRRLRSRCQILVEQPQRHHPLANEPVLALCVDLRQLREIQCDGRAVVARLRRQRWRGSWQRSCLTPVSRTAFRSRRPGLPMQPAGTGPRGSGQITASDLGLMRRFLA